MPQMILPKMFPASCVYFVSWAVMPSVPSAKATASSAGSAGLGARDFQFAKTRTLLPVDHLGRAPWVVEFRGETEGRGGRSGTKTPWLQQRFFLPLFFFSFSCERTWCVLRSQRLKTSEGGGAQCELQAPQVIHVCGL